MNRPHATHGHPRHAVAERNLEAILDAAEQLMARGGAATISCAEPRLRPAGADPEYGRTRSGVRLRPQTPPKRQRTSSPPYGSAPSAARSRSLFTRWTCSERDTTRPAEQQFAPSRLPILTLLESHSVRRIGVLTPFCVASAVILERHYGLSLASTELLGKRVVTRFSADCSSRVWDSSIYSAASICHLVQCLSPTKPATSLNRSA